MSKVKVNLGVKYEQKQKENDENGDIYFGDGVRWRQDNCCRILIIEHQPIVSLVIDHVDDEDDDRDGMTTMKMIVITVRISTLLYSPQEHYDNFQEGA